MYSQHHNLHDNADHVGNGIMTRSGGDGSRYDHPLYTFQQEHVSILYPCHRQTQREFIAVQAQACILPLLGILMLGCCLAHIVN